MPHSVQYKMEGDCVGQDRTVCQGRYHWPFICGVCGHCCTLLDERNRTRCGVPRIIPTPKMDGRKRYLAEV